jgi:hypothetical protein
MPEVGFDFVILPPSNQLNPFVDGNHYFFTRKVIDKK